MPNFVCRMEKHTKLRIFITKSEGFNMILGSSSKFKAQNSRVLALNDGGTPLHSIEIIRFCDENPQLGVLFHPIDEIWNKELKSSLSAYMVHVSVKHWSKTVGYAHR